jgi:hypothetical protein
LKRTNNWPKVFPLTETATLALCFREALQHLSLFNGKPTWTAWYVN